MGIKIFKKVKATHPDLIACWSGIGNIGLIAVDTLRSEIQASALLYPKASKSVLEVLTRILGIRLDLRTFDNYVAQSEATIEKFYEHLPSGLKDQLEKFKSIRYIKPALTIPTMTAEDKKKLMEDIEKFLQKKEGDQI